MALWVCMACGCRYSVGAPCCPQCGGTDHEEDSVPKISVGAGPSNALADAEDDAAAHAAWAENAVDDGVAVTGPGPDGSDDVSAGSSSSTSASKPAASSRSTPSEPPSPAPATVSPSATPPAPTPAPASSSSASSAAGSTPGTGSAPSSSDPPPLRAPKQEWVEHAVAAGAVAPEEAADMTKAEIVETVTAGEG